MTEKMKKALKLPEAGQWPDRITPTVLVAGIVLSTIGFLLAFLWASPVNGAAVNGGLEMIGGQMVTRTSCCCRRRSSTSTCRWPSRRSSRSRSRAIMRFASS